MNTSILCESTWSQSKNGRKDNSEPISITIKGAGEEQVEVTRFVQLDIQLFDPLTADMF